MLKYLQQLVSSITLLLIAGVKICGAQNTTKPNVIVILLDDSRSDTYSCNGAPSFFQTPNIDRIANEGVNFKNSFVVFSLCNPSRASLFTGLYANHHGAVNNVEMFYDYLPTISTVLNSAGYYTAFMGKYMNANDQDPVPQPGWDWWMARVGHGHSDADFNYNGVVKELEGHVTDVLTDSTIALINKVTEPFLIYVCYSATHSPTKPRDEEDGIFDDDEMPIPDNFEPYQINYPSFLGTEPFFSHDSAGLADDWRGYFEMMAGVDVGVSKILAALEAKQILDSTLVIFMSDNGFLMGEHYLQGKRLPHEPSMRIPIFMRYPAWFPAGSIVTDDMALNIDIAPTLFDLAGIPDTVASDGLSMHKLFDGSKSRTAFYYQATTVNEAAVNCRSVRSLEYKYNYYYCDEITEEFFDLVNDPAENTNLINDAAHQSLIEQYRIQLDSFKAALGDDIIEDISDCYLANSIPVGLNNDEDEIRSATEIFIYPNPASNAFELQLYSGDFAKPAEVMIYNMESMEVLRLTDVVFSPGVSHAIPTFNLPDGLYNILVRFESKVINKKILIVH